MVEYHTSLIFTGETYQEAAKLVHSKKAETAETPIQAKPLVFVFCLAVAFSIVFLLNEFPGLNDLVVPLSCLLIGFIMGVVGCVIFALNWSKRTYQSQQPVEYSYIFRDHAIEITQPYAHAIYSWEGIKRLVTGEKYWLLILANNENLFLPLDARAMSEELKKFLLVKVKERGEEASA